MYFGFYNFSKLLVLTRVLFDGLDAKSLVTPGPPEGFFELCKWSVVLLKGTVGHRPSVCCTLHLAIVNTALSVFLTSIILKNYFYMHVLCTVHVLCMYNTCTAYMYMYNTCTVCLCMYYTCTVCI